jgi:hypothetical protein
VAPNSKTGYIYEGGGIYKTAQIPFTFSSDDFEELHKKASPESTYEYSC